MKRRKRLIASGDLNENRPDRHWGGAESCLVIVAESISRVAFRACGFRYTAKSLARGFEVAGYVRNLPDGRVELVAEGDTDELDAFLASIRLEMDTYITNVTTEAESPGEHPLIGFSIRY